MYASTGVEEEDPNTNMDTTDVYEEPEESEEESEEESKEESDEYDGNQINEQIRNEFGNPGAYSAPDDDYSAWIRANSYWNCVAKV